MKKYLVHNYHSFISLPTEDIKKPLFIDAGNFNEMKPFSKQFTLEQIVYINLYSDVFKTGRLEFDESVTDEIFEELGIQKENDIYFTASDIMDIINTPTKEKLERVISIKDLNTIDLFRGILVSFKNLGTHDTSNRVMTLINKRRDEIYRNPSQESLLKVKETAEEKESKVREQAMQEAMEKALKDMEDKLKKEYDKKLKKALDKAKKDETKSKEKDE